MHDTATCRSNMWSVLRNKAASREAFDTSEANDLNTHACDLPLKQYHEMVNLHWGFRALLML